MSRKNSRKQPGRTAGKVLHRRNFAALQRKSLDSGPSSVTRVAIPDFRKEIAMDQKTVFAQMQQFGTEWLKLVSEGTNRFTLALAEVEKIEKQGVAQVVSAVDEAGRVAKEAINASEQISAQWRRAVNEYAQRTVELLTPKN